MSDVPPFDPEELLRLADTLATRDATEAMLLTAVNRAYYAVFLLAREKTGVTGRRGVHERVRTTLSATHPNLASKLGTMSNFREVADYELLPQQAQNRDWRRNWNEQRRNATRALDELRKLP